MDPSESPWCRFCGDSFETFMHLTINCLAFHFERAHFFGVVNIGVFMSSEILNKCCVFLSPPGFGIFSILMKWESELANESESEIDSSINAD